MSARSARTPIAVAQCCRIASTEVMSAPAALDVVNESWKLIPNSAAPEETRVSGEVLLYGRNSTSSPASRNQPCCYATNRPVWLVFGVQSSATRIFAGAPPAELGGAPVPPWPPAHPANRTETSRISSTRTVLRRSDLGRSHWGRSRWGTVDGAMTSPP